jgi:hypothetical protein
VAGFYLSIRLTSWQKLDEQNPILWKKFISLFDKDILLFLKQVEFLDPIHSIHCLAFKHSQEGIRDFSYVLMPRHTEVFLNFFLDPSRSGKYHLTPQNHANIVVWMIQGIFVRRFQCDDHRANIRTPLASSLPDKSGGKLGNPVMIMPIGIHLSHASRCAEQLIEIICSYNPKTFPLMGHLEVRGIVVLLILMLINVQKFLFLERVMPQRDLELLEKHREDVRRETARYLLVRCTIIVQSSFGIGVLTHPMTG